MDADSLDAKNLFARITSFTAEAGSDRVENLCTEVLAWCLLKSKGFRQSFLKCFGVVGMDGAEIHTQFPVEIPKAGRGFCDLVVVPRNHQGIGLFVELKVWSNFRENQLSDYRRAAKKKMPSLEPRIVTVTPFADPPAGSDRHVTWSEIFEMLKRATGGDDVIELSEFADFLKLRGMSKPVVIDPIDARAVAQWRAVAAKVEQLNELFALLAFDKRVKRIFGGELDKPKFEYDEGTGGRAWLGVYASKGGVWFYAGIGALQGGEAVMLVDVAVSGDRLAAIKRLGSLQKEFAQAKPYATEIDNWANRGRVEGEGRKTETHFVFAQRIDDKYNGHSKRIGEWFTDVVLRADEFVRTCLK